MEEFQRTLGKLEALSNVQQAHCLRCMDEMSKRVDALTGAVELLREDRVRRDTGFAIFYTIGGAAIAVLSFLSPHLMQWFMGGVHGK